MKPATLVLLGAAAGLVAARFLINPSSCCSRVSAGVKEKVSDKLGGTTANVLDDLGLFDYAPGLLDLFGVPK